VGKETAALALIALVHLLGAAMLVWAIGTGGGVDWRGWWPRDDGPEPPEPPAGPPGGPVLLDTAAPAAARLRTEHERLADAHRRARRPEHAPDRERTPA